MNIVNEDRRIISNSERFLIMNLSLPCIVYNNMLTVKKEKRTPNIVPFMPLRIARKM